MFKKIFYLVKKLLLKEVYYIHSRDILPPPLKKDEELELLIKSKQDDKEALDTLICHNLRLVVFIAKRFESPKACLEDLISIGSMGLMKGVKTFKLDKNIKLATYASRCIENEILMFLRKTSKLSGEISLDETLNTDSEGNKLMLIDVLHNEDDNIVEDVIKSDERYFMIKAVRELPEREKEIIVLRYGLNGDKALTQKEVAIFLDISQSYISRLEKRIIDKLKQNIFEDMKVIPA